MRAPALEANRRGSDRSNPRLALRYTLAGETAGLILDAILATVRWDIQGAEHHRGLVDAGQPYILAVWHGRLLPAGYLHRRGGHSMMISRSKDGEYASGLARHWGQVPVRGSSSRGGGKALLELLAHAAAGHPLAFTPDGPRGPRHVLKDGVVVAAQRSGLPILPMSAGASRGWYTRGWDRMLVPRPFSTVRVRYAEPFSVDPSEDVETVRARLEATLLRLTALADGDDAGVAVLPAPRGGTAPNAGRRA